MIGLGSDKNLCRSDFMSDNLTKNLVVNQLNFFSVTSFILLLINRKIVNLKLELVEIVVYAFMTVPIFYISYLVELSFFHIFLLSVMSLIPLKDFSKLCPCNATILFVSLCEIV